MTELYKRSLTNRREALAKHRPAYFARRKRISVSSLKDAKYSKLLTHLDFFSAAIAISSYSGAAKALISLWRVTKSVFYYIVVALSNGFTLVCGTVYISENLEPTAWKTVFWTQYKTDA